MDTTDATPEDFRAAVAAIGSAASAFVGGDGRSYKSSWAQRDDVTIFGGWGAYERGWAEVGPRLDWAAARFTSGGTEPEILTMAASGDLGYTVALERGHAQLAGTATASAMVLRVTHIYRRLDGAWKLVHRYADPITEKTAPPAVLASDTPRQAAR